MDYIIQSKKQYISCGTDGKYVETPDIEQAVKGPMHKLQNIINNCISPNKRRHCKIVEFHVNKNVVAPLPVNQIVAPSRFDHIVSQLKSIDFTGLDGEQNTLSQQLSFIDQEISDIQHYIEFNRLNAAQGYKAFKLLQDKLLERRAIKNDFAKFQMLTDAKMSDVFDGTLDKKLTTLNEKTYTPRVLKELF